MVDLVSVVSRTAPIEVRCRGGPRALLFGTHLCIVLP
jgi:hypothetical protein